MATELAKAYVQIIPSAKGIKNNIEKSISGEIGEAGDSAGKAFGSKLVGSIKGLIATAGIGKTIAASISEGAALQQSMGGIETLFKENYSKVEKYANEAFKTAGLSANSYMEQVTGFSASLLQSLGGDTNKAADAANQALIDMSDNANKMGTDMQSIQFAYQGFAKQNYTMLDNLKLGYGGTKTEMERLLADAQKLTGAKYDITNLSDVYSAIHVIQQNLGITGTTAKEAEETFTGSFAAMKGALSNFLATLSLGEQGTMNITQAMSGLLSSAVTFLIDNALPMLISIITTFPEAIFTALDSYSTAGVQGYVSKLFSFLNQFISERLPEMITHGLSAAANFVIGVVQSVPNLIASASELITNFCSGMSGNFGAILETAKNTVITLVTGIINNIPSIIESAVNLLTSFIKGISNHLPDIVLTGIKIIAQLAVGIIKQVPNLIAQIPNIIKSLLKAFSSIMSGIKDIGVNLVKGLWNGIKSVKDWIINKVKGFGKAILDGIKNFFGIHSPSTVMGDQVGVFMAEGIGVGFADGMRYVQKEMEKSIPTNFDVTPTIGYNYKYTAIGSQRNTDIQNSDYQKNGQLIVDALSKVTIKHITTLNGNIVAEESYPIIDKLIGQNLILGERGV